MTRTRKTTMTSTQMPPKTLTRGGEVIRWVEANCRFTNGELYGRPFRFLPWQKRFIRQLFTVDRATGRRQYRWSYLSVPKKNGKSELLAALALWFLLASGEPAPLIVVAAGSDDQADLIFGAC